MVSSKVWVRMRVPRDTHNGEERDDGEGGGRVERAAAQPIPASSANAPNQRNRPPPRVGTAGAARRTYATRLRTDAIVGTVSDIGLVSA